MTRGWGGGELVLARKIFLQKWGQQSVSSYMPNENFARSVLIAG